jgi:hypothetical protein
MLCNASNVQVYFNAKKCGFEFFSPECCGSEMFIPDPNFSIPDPGSTRFRIRIKEFKYFNPKIVSKLSEI